MTGFEIWPAGPAAHVVGWSLLHFAWQGALLALALKLALDALGGSATLRYAAGCATLFLMLAAPLTTAVELLDTGLSVAGEPPTRAAAYAGTWQRTPGAGADANARPEQGGALELAAGRPWLATAAAAIEARLPFVTAVWLAGVALFALRLGACWLGGLRLTRRTAGPVPSSVLAAAARLASAFGVERAVRVVQSTALEVPALVGHLRPVIMLPASALLGLSPAQLEAVIAHELAHVRRHDYVVNLVQSLVETLLFYHPAVWWVSRQVRLERENCCDDLAAAVCGPLPYARALARLEQHRGLAPQAALAATGGVLMHRIRRIVKPSALPPEPGRSARLLSAAIAVALAALILGGTGSRAAAPDAGEPRLAAAPSVGRPVIAGGESLHDEDEPLFGRRTSLDRRLENGVRLGVVLKGDVDLDEATGRLAHLGPDGLIVLDTELGSSHQRVLLTGLRSGAIDATWLRDGERADYDAAAKAWTDAALAVAAGHLRISSRRGERSSLLGEIASVRGERSSLLGQIASLRGERSSLHGQISGARGERSSLRGAVSSIQAERRALEGRLTGIRGRQRALRAERRADPDAVAAESAALEAEAERVQEELAQGGFEDRIKEVEAELTRLDIDIERQVAEVQARLAEVDVEAMEAEIQKQIAALDVEGQVAGLEQRLAALDSGRQEAQIRSELESLERELKQRIEALAGSARPEPARSTPSSP